MFFLEEEKKSDEKTIIYEREPVVCGGVVVWQSDRRNYKEHSHIGPSLSWPVIADGLPREQFDSYATHIFSLIYFSRHFLYSFQVNDGTSRSIFGIEKS